MITDKKQIASIFNDYFLNLASDIAEPVAIFKIIPVSEPF